MRLGLKLAAIGLVLLTPKTQHYLFDTYFSGAQTALDRPISDGPAAHWVRIEHTVLAAEDKQRKTSTCVVNPGDDAWMIHAMHKGPNGTHG